MCLTWRHWPSTPTPLAQQVRRRFKKFCRIKHITKLMCSSFSVSLCLYFFILFPLLVYFSLNYRSHSNINSATHAPHIKQRIAQNRCCRCLSFDMSWSAANELSGRLNIIIFHVLEQFLTHNSVRSMCLLYHTFNTSTEKSRCLPAHHLQSLTHSTLSHIVWYQTNYEMNYYTSCAFYICM